MQNNAFWQKVKNLLLIYHGFPKVIYFVFIARFINAMGYFVFPFLTLFLTRNLSMSANRVGVYLMLVEIGRMSGALLGGKLADHLGRKLVIIVCQIATALFLFPCAFLEESVLIPQLLIFAAFFNGAIHPAVDAILVDVSHPDNRKEIFSFIYLGLNLGFGIGSLIAGFLYTNHIPLLFLGNGFAILIVSVIIARYVSETAPNKALKQQFKHVQETPGAQRLHRKSPENVISALMKQPVVFYFFLVSILFFLAHSQFFFSLPLQIDDIFLAKGPAIFGIVMSFNCFIVVLMTLPVTGLSRHYRPIINIVWSGLLFAVGFGMLSWISALGWIFLSTFIWTIGEILIRINAGVYIANHSPETVRGRFNSLVTVSGSISRMIGPPLLGFVISSYGIRKVWMVIFLISALASFLMFLIHRYEENFLILKSNKNE